MASFAQPPGPPQHPLRVATAVDIPRMAEISVLCCADQEVFPIKCAEELDQPNDAYDSFEVSYQRALLDPRALIVVIEDEVGGAGSEGGAAGIRLTHIVGRCIWTLPEGSQRRGQNSPVEELEASMSHDKEDRALRFFEKQRIDRYLIPMANMDVEQFSGKMNCTWIHVHPSYRRRGHARALLQWGLSVASADEVDQWAVSSNMARPLFASLGYEEVSEMEVPRDGDFEGFTQSVFIYKVSGNAEG